MIKIHFIINFMYLNLNSSPNTPKKYLKRNYKNSIFNFSRDDLIKKHPKKDLLN